MAETSGRPFVPPPPPPIARTAPTEQAASVPSAAELERAIASVAGVQTAQVSRSEDGRDRLRISLTAGADPESAAWAVAATLRERFGIALDPASIVALPTNRPAEDTRNGLVEDPDAREPVIVGAGVGSVPRSARRQPRAAIGEVSALGEGDDLDVTATLSLHDRVATGTARGIPTRRGRWRAIGEATLDALGDLTGGRIRATVDHISVLPFPDLAHVTVAVTLLTERGEETFLGAALLRDDADRAVMRATLDAVNRRVEPWLGSAT